MTADQYARARQETMAMKAVGVVRSSVRSREEMPIHGVTAQIDTVGKGSNEPIHLPDTSGLSQDDIYALNRRVELQRE